MKIVEIKDKIIHGDTLKILKQIPDNSIDLWITSPPYNKGENKKWRLVENVKYKWASDKKNENEYQQEQIHVLNEIFRVIKPWWSFFYNHKIRREKWIMYHPISWINQTKWTIRQEIIWDRMIAANIRWWRFWQVEERKYWLYKPIDNNKIWKELKSKHALLTSIWRIPPEKNNSHPAPFPVELPTRIIYSIFDNEKNKIILDPYMWSWTTAIAAKALNHHFIWIDISKEYINYAYERLKNIEQFLPQIEKELSLHKVEKTFKERKEKKEFTGKHSPITQKKIIPLF